MANKAQNQADAREEYIERKLKALRSRVDSLQISLYNEMLSKIVSELEVENNIIRNVNRNFVKASLIDKVYDLFNETEHIKVIETLKRNLIRIGVLNANYFSKFDRRKASQIKPSIQNVIRRNLGINGQDVILKDGFLGKLVNDEILRNEIKDLTFQAVSSSQSFQEFRRTLKTIISGDETYKGGLQRHYRTYAYDTYMNIDRQNQVLYSSKLNMTAFIYGGAIFRDSRPFCKGGKDSVAGTTFHQKKGEVFLIEEAKGWSKLRKFQGKNRNYNPLVNLGGHNCTDSLNYVDDDTAIQLRDDLFLENGVLKAKAFRNERW